MARVRGWLTFILLLGLVLWPGLCVADAARDCVVDISKALDNSDVQLFKARVDVDQVIGQAIDVFLVEAKKPYIRNNLQPMLAIMLQQASSGEGAGQAIRALLVKESRAFVLNGIATGAFAGKRVRPNVEQGLLTPLFADASIGRKEIIQIGEGQATDSGWIVPFTLLDGGNGSDYAIDGLIQETASGLKLTKIINLPDLFLQIQEEAEQFSR